MKRWGVLFCFSLAAGLSQLLWLNFAPILSFVQKQYGVSESQAGLLLLVFPLIYVFLSIHAGSLTDRKGYRYSLLLGTSLMAIFSCARIEISSFWLLLAAQVGIAVAQPYVVNSISKLVLDWFEKKHEALATGIGTMGMFLGMAFGMASTPLLVEKYGFQGAMVFFAVVSVLVFLICFRWVKVNPENIHASAPRMDFLGDLKTLFKNRQLIVVIVLAFMGLGYFNGLTTWLEPILAPHGLNSAQAGLVGGLLIIGGVIGSAVIPALSDYLKTRKKVLIFCLVLGLITLYPLTVSSTLLSASVLAVIQGFFFLPAFALLLEMCAELAGADLAGSATGVLMLAGNAGGVVVILAMEWVKGDSATFDNSVVLLLILLAASIVTTFKLRETFRGGSE